MDKKMAFPPVFMILVGTLPAFLILFCSAAIDRHSDKVYPFEVQVSGKGSKSIVFIPGFASAGEVWDETKAKFEKSHTCYTLTMAGFAGAKPQAGATFKAWEASIAEFIEDNDIDKPTIVGHSMGGVMALALAADYPELIGKIVVVDALPCLSAMNNPAFQSVEKPECSAMVDQMKRESDDQFRQMQKVTARSLSADTTKHELILNWSMKSDRATMGGMFCNFLNTDLREKIKSVSCPALVLLQPYFKNFPAAIEAQYKNLRTGNLQYANKGLHFIMYDDKQWYMGQLSAFIGSK